MAESRWSGKRFSRSRKGAGKGEKRSGEGGFSLLELMIALAVFVVSIGVLLSAQTAAARHQERARNLYIATALLRELVSTAETEGIPEAGDEETSGDFGEKFPDYKWKRKITDAYADASLLTQAEQFGIDLDNVKAALPGIRQVTATVTWGDEEKADSAEVTWYAVTGWAKQSASTGFAIPKVVP